MRNLLFIALSTLLFTCGSGSTPEWPELDLTKYSVPIKIMAPDSVQVKSQTLSGIMHDVTIISPEDKYNIQILSSQASTNDMTRLKAEQLSNVRDNRYFNRVVREEPNGFVFENKIDSTSAFGFRYIVYQGDQEYVFLNGLSGIYTEAEIEAMYAAVKQTK